MPSALLSAKAPRVLQCRLSSPSSRVAMIRRSVRVPASDASGGSSCCGGASTSVASVIEAPKQAGSSCCGGGSSTSSSSSAAASSSGGSCCGGGGGGGGSKASGQSQIMSLLAGLEDDSSNTVTREQMAYAFNIGPKQATSERELDVASLLRSCPDDLVFVDEDEEEEGVMV